MIDLSGLTCPRCGSPLVEDEDGVLKCPVCGYVSDEDNIDDRPDWRVISQTGSVKGLERASAINNLMRHDRGIGDVRYIQPRSRSVLKRVSALRGVRISRAHPLLSGEASAVALFKLANEAADHFELPQAARQTLGAILQAYVEKSRRSVGKEKEEVVAAAIEKVVEVFNLGLSKSEIRDYFELDDRDVWNGLRRLNESGALEVLKMSRRMEPGDASKKLIERTMTYVNKILSELNLPQSLATEVLSFLRASLEAGNKTPYGKRPEALAAAAVYLVARLHGYDISQASVAGVVNLRESTVRKLYRFLMSDMVIVVDL